MRVRNAPLGFVTGGTLSPRVINENRDHIAKHIEDVAGLRFTHCVLTMPYHKTLAAGYTNSDSTEVREYIINLPTRWSVERAYLRFYGTTGAAVTIDVYEGATLWEDDYLSIASGLSTESSSAFNGKRLECSANTDIKFRMNGTSFTSSNTWLELHIRADRFNTDGTDGTPSYTPSLVSSSDARDADAFNSQTTLASSATTTVNDEQTFTKVELYVAHNIPTSGTSSTYGWQIPRVDSDNTKRSLAQMRAYRLMNSTPAGATSAQWTLTDDNSTSEASLEPTGTGTSASASTSTFTTGEASTASPDLSDPADSWTLGLDYGTGTDTIDKTYCLLIYD